MFSLLNIKIQSLNFGLYIHIVIIKSSSSIVYCGPDSTQILLELTLMPSVLAASCELEDLESKGSFDPVVGESFMLSK
jgi:hypothetical protein